MSIPRCNLPNRTVYSTIFFFLQCRKVGRGKERKGASIGSESSHSSTSLTKKKESTRYVFLVFFSKLYFHDQNLPFFQFFGQNLYTIGQHTSYLTIVPLFDLIFFHYLLFLHSWRFELDSFQTSKNQTLYLFASTLEECRESGEGASISADRILRNWGYNIA